LTGPETKSIAQVPSAHPADAENDEHLVTATMIDRLAKTLKEALNGYDAGDDLILTNERHSEASIRELARKVLVEIRSPTDDMRRAGAIFFEMDEGEAVQAASIVYVDMIDAALAG
jgi:predicted transcriptional regulator